MFAVINLIFQTKRFFHGEIYPQCADRMANNTDPVQTAPSGAV